MSGRRGEYNEDQREHGRFLKESAVGYMEPLNSGLNRSKIGRVNPGSGFDGGVDNLSKRKRISKESKPVDSPHSVPRLVAMSNCRRARVLWYLGWRPCFERTLAYIDPQFSDSPTQSIPQ